MSALIASTRCMAWVTAGRPDRGADLGADVRVEARVPRPASMRLRLPALSLRLRLALLSLALLALPWFGYRYVREMERFLLDAQLQTLLGTARAVATALHDRPGLVDVPAAAAQAGADNTRQQAEALLQQLAVESQLPPDLQPQHESSLPGSPLAREPVAPLRDEVRSAEIAAILKGLERTTSRIWVVNRRYRLLALAGELRRPNAPAAEQALSRRFMEWLIPPPREDFDEAAPDDVLATGKEIANALQGLPGTRMRTSPDGLAVIMSAAHPVWSGDEVLGAVVVEETTNSILTVRKLALERLLVVTLAVFAVAAAALMWFAFRVSSRIIRLRDEAEAAIDARGRITGLVSGQRSSDEIGDLSRSFSSVLSRLSQQQAYLETLADRLSHELRTPVAVVRSSLENLRASLPEQTAQTYIVRAEEGLARLSAILNRMTEATRLEQSLHSADREDYEMSAVVSACVSGYRSAWPQTAFELELPAGTVPVRGSPDLLAQLLDKLVDNAVDYSTAGQPVRIVLHRLEQRVQLSVVNAGPLLAEGLAARLFNAMVSLREGDQGGGLHLGLGLYVARLIAEFHGGRIAALNRPDGSGVEMRVTLPMAVAGVP